MPHGFDPINGITGSGATNDISTVPAGSAAGKASVFTATTVPAVVPAVANRVSVNILNNEPLASTNLLYFGFTALEADTTSGWPIRPQGSVVLDVAVGVDLYIRSASGSIEVRLLELGNS